MAVNLRHSFFGAQAAIPGMRARRRRDHQLGLDQLAPAAWRVWFSTRPPRPPSKGLTRSLARELGRDNIRVNAIIPGNVQTPRQEKWYTPEGEREIVAAQCLNGRIQPSDIAAMALFLASTMRA